MSIRTRILAGAAALMLGALLGWLAGSLVPSDNLPFFVALGALAGLWAGSSAVCTPFNLNKHRQLLIQRPESIDTAIAQAR